MHTSSATVPAAAENWGGGALTVGARRYYPPGMFHRDSSRGAPPFFSDTVKPQVKQISMTQKLRLANLICKLEQYNKPNGPSVADIAQDVSVGRFLLKPHPLFFCLARNYEAVYYLASPVKPSPCVPL